MKPAAVPMLFICLLSITLSLIHPVCSIAQVTPKEFSFGVADYSPDGKWIAAGGPKGFRIYARENLDLIHYEDMPAYVEYMKWLPDSRRILLYRSIVEDDFYYGSEYVIFDTIEKKRLLTFEDTLNWYYYDGPSPVTYEIIQNDQPGSAHGAADCLAFAPDGSEMAYFTSQNHIKFVSTKTGEVRLTIEEPEYHIVALGYTDDGKQVWAGTYSTPDTHRENWVLFYDAQTGRLVEKKELRMEGVPNKTFPFVRAVAVRNDKQYALAITPISTMETNSVGEIYLFNLQTGEYVETICSGRVGILSTIRHRASFVGQEGVIALQSIGREGTTKRVFYSFDTGMDGLNLPENLLTSQGVYTNENVAFSPDGKEFLLVKPVSIQRVNSKTMEYEEILMDGASVDEFELY